MSAVKIFFEVDGAIKPFTFNNNAQGQQALGELIFNSLADHEAYIMITPDDLNELVEELNG